MLGTLTGGSGIVFPVVLIPIYAVPREFLIHSYSLFGLLRNTFRDHAPAASPSYAFDSPRSTKNAG